MTGDCIEQLTDIGNAGIFPTHLVGLITAVAGAVGMVLRRGGPIAAAAA